MPETAHKYTARSGWVPVSQCGVQTGGPASQYEVLHTTQNHICFIQDQIPAQDSKHKEEFKLF